MNPDESLRIQLCKILDWEDAHVSFDAATKGIAPDKRGVVPKSLPYSLWQLLEHLRRTQLDILEFCQNPNYVEPPFEEYWPRKPEPPSPEAWDESVNGYKRDREQLKQIAMDRELDLFEKIPHGSGQTYLRELLLVADHNAYHIGEIVVVRRSLGIWG